METEQLNKAFDEIRSRYENFVLTTICRQNIKLYKELQEALTSSSILSKDLIVHKVPEYLSADESSIEKIGFNGEIEKYLKNKLKSPYEHQINAWTKIMNNQDCIIATGTGSGKTEAFLFPIIEHCLHRDEEGVKSIIIYPMKALTSDQGNRIGEILDELNHNLNRSLSYAIFDGDSPDEEGEKLRKHSGWRSEKYYKKDILKNPPDILLTNYVMLERILLFPKYSYLLKTAKIKFICLDEIHYYSGAQGIDVSLLLRRLQFRLTNTKEVRYIGTSATLSNDTKNFPDIKLFLKNVFNKEFDENSIVLPEYSDFHKNHDLRKARPISECQDDMLNDTPIKAHAFFKSPPSFFRCIECKRIHNKKETCECGSNLVFEISTCRQCGAEYFSIKVSVDENKDELKLDQLNVVGKLKIKDFLDERDQKLLTINATTSKDYEDTKKLKLCKETYEIYHEDEDISDYIEIFAIDHSSINLVKKINDNYCPACEYEDSRQSVIAEASKISDENCSHVLFNESFMHLSPEKRKLLIFTDNVQRTSKFAREIEETHLKNIARKYLTEHLNELENPEKISHTIFFVLERIKETSQQGILPETEESIKKELYEEILDPGKKAASLKNRNLFLITPKRETNLSEEDFEKYKLILPIFIKNKLVKSYFDILTTDESDQIGKYFIKKEKLFEQIYRELNGLQKKTLKTKKFPEVEKFIERLKECNLLDIYNEWIFLKETSIMISYNKDSIEEKNNYYASWNKFSHIPLIRAETDTGKTKSEERSSREKDFKDKNNMIMVATSTLELGIDIGTLDCVGILYAPPSSAQYLQRVGRCGRHKKSSLAITYLAKRSLDQTYFDQPEILINGDIRPPRFKIYQDIPQKKSLFSLFLEYLTIHTDFGKELWTKVDFWTNQLEKIQAHFSKNIQDFWVYAHDYILDNKIEDTPANIKEEWLRLLSNYCEIHKATKQNNNRNEEVFSFLKKARLLPDYAFGSGGTIVKIKDGTIINNYSLTETCPPSTIDHNKTRYKSEKINLYPNKYSILAERYKVEQNRDVIYTNKDLTNSELELIDMDKEIIEPHIIYGKRTTSALKNKFILWEKKLVDPEIDMDVIDDITEPFETIIATLFSEEILESGKSKDCYFDVNGQTTENQKNKLNKKIGSFLKTRAIILECDEISNKITYKNALLSATKIIAECDDGEIDGFNIDDSHIAIYDNVDGGVGFVDTIKEKREEVFNQMRKLLRRDCCTYGCVRCIGSYSKQFEMDMLDKKGLLKEIRDN